MIYGLPTHTWPVATSMTRSLSFASTERSRSFFKDIPCLNLAFRPYIRSYGPCNNASVSFTNNAYCQTLTSSLSGRYNNASEVVRDAVRRMEEQEAREAWLAQPAAELMLADLASEQRDSIRRLVRKRLEAATAGDFVEYAGREGLRRARERSQGQGAQAASASRLGASLSSIDRDGV